MLYKYWMWMGLGKRLGFMIRGLGSLGLSIMLGLLILIDWIWKIIRKCYRFRLKHHKGQVNSTYLIMSLSNTNVQHDALNATDNQTPASNAMVSS